jgi:hypothetical protein
LKKSQGKAPMNLRFTVCIASIAASAALAGCVSTKSISHDDATALQGKTIVVDTYEPPFFTAFTAGKSWGGLPGMLLAIKEGKSFIRDNQIADPAVAIGNDLAHALAMRYSVVVEPRRDAELLTIKDSIDTIVAKYPSADLILDSRTLYWGYDPFPWHEGTYHLTFAAKIRLIDAHSKTVLAEGRCQHVPEYSADMPNYETLTANGGAWVKAQLRSKVDSCVSEFGASSLELPQISHQAVATQPSLPPAE